MISVSVSSFLLSILIFLQIQISEKISDAKYVITHPKKVSQIYSLKRNLIAAKKVVASEVATMKDPQLSRLLAHCQKLSEGLRIIGEITLEMEKLGIYTMSVKINEEAEKRYRLLKDEMNVSVYYRKIVEELEQEHATFVGQGLGKSISTLQASLTRIAQNSEILKSYGKEIAQIIENSKIMTNTYEHMYLMRFV